MFFKLFFDAEPFTAILIAHGNHAGTQKFVLRACMRPEGPKFEAKGGEEVFGIGQRAPSPLAKGAGERHKLPQRGMGWNPTANAF